MLKVIEGLATTSPWLAGGLALALVVGVVWMALSSLRPNGSRPHTEHWWFKGWGVDMGRKTSHRDEADPNAEPDKA